MDRSLLCKLYWRENATKAKVIREIIEQTLVLGIYKCVESVAG